MAAMPAQRRFWPVATAMSGACTLLAMGLGLSGNGGTSWGLVSAGLALLTMVSAMFALFSNAALARDLNEASARATAAEDECNLLQRDVNRHDQLEQQLLQAKRAAKARPDVACSSPSTHGWRRRARGTGSTRRQPKQPASATRPSGSRLLAP